MASSYTTFLIIVTAKVGVGDIFVTYFNAIVLLFAFEFHFGSSSNRQ